MHPSGTLEELLSHHDERFIHAAYQTLLNRVPDPEGMRYYLTRLRNNISKVEILAQLRNSDEGKSRPLKITGLNEVIKRHKQLKTPLLGSLIRLASSRKIDEIAKPNIQQIEVEKKIHLAQSLRERGLHEGNLPLNLTLEVFNKLNPEDQFDDLYLALIALISQSPIRKLRIFKDDELNANFYVLIAIQNELEGRNADAIEIYRLSLLFANTPTAHEHLGNLSLRDGRPYQAIEYYKAALKYNSRSDWVYANLSKAQAICGKYKESVDTLCRGLKAHVNSDMLISKVDECIQNFWQIEEQRLDFIATSQNRDALIDEYESVTSFIADSYAAIYSRSSEKPIVSKLNNKKVLIIGLTNDGAPQCFRYRIEQKIEQLQFVGYEAETVAWYDQALGLKKIGFCDLIIFYRVPAFPGVLKLVEYAKSLGKITFFEVDDLLFDAKSVPALETYGGQISLATYTNVTKDIGSYRSMAIRCDYAIASTLPLIKKLAELVRTKIGYLHRNGLDKYNRTASGIFTEKGYINLFYGSGTLAHNSDFIIEALPAILRILREHENVKLTVVGYLTLPPRVIREFEGRLIQVPLVTNIAGYWEYLSASDINLAVLHDDELTACKSELKWFEAAAFSIPSVVSRTQNYLDVIKNGDDGFIVYGEHEWYDALKNLVTNPKLRREVGLRAFTRVKSEYSVESLSRNIDKIMKSALKHHDSVVRGPSIESNQVYK